MATREERIAAAKVAAEALNHMLALDRKAVQYWFEVVGVPANAELKAELNMVEHELFNPFTLISAMFGTRDVGPRADWSLLVAVYGEGVILLRFEVDEAERFKAVEG